MITEPEITAFRPDRPGIRKVLGDLEAEIMELIWQRPIEAGTTVRAVFEIVYERRQIAYTTVMNTMTRLAKKHLLRAEKQEQAYVYYPTLTQEAFILRFVGRILEDLLVNFAGATMERLEAISDQKAATHPHALLREITHDRHMEEGSEPLSTVFLGEL